MLFPPEENITRSIWRETKLLIFLMTTGFIDIGTVLNNFYAISKHLSVEKRRKPRPLQMTDIKLSQFICGSVPLFCADAPTSRIAQPFRSSTLPRSTQPRSLPLSFISSAFTCVKKIWFISSNTTTSKTLTILSNYPCE